MGIELKEYIGSTPSVKKSNKANADSNGVSIKEGLLSGVSPIKKNSLMQNIEGLHAGPTGNYNWYTKEALKKSVNSWLCPYNKPLIMHHNEASGKTIGRIVDCEYVEVNTRSGTPALRFLCNIPDKDGIEQIEDGRLLTVSVGVKATDVSCSICGKQIEELDEYGNADCGHIKGEVYDNQICYWMVNDMTAKELSYVIVPSDKYACNLNSWRVGEDKKYKLAENINIENKNGNLNLEEALKMNNEKEIKENLIIEEEIVDKKKIEDKEGEKNGVQDKEKEDNKEEEVADENKANEEDESKALKDRVKELEKELETNSKDAKQAKKLLVLAQEKIDKLVKDVEAKNKEVEQAEDEIVAVKTELREYMESNIISLKEMAGEKIEEGFKDSLSIETSESLKGTMISLSESIKAKKPKVQNEIKITECSDPTLKDTSKDLKKKEKEIVNIEKRESNVSLEEALSLLYEK